MKINNIDEFGRVTLPMDVRKILNIGEFDDVVIISDGNALMLKKYEPEAITRIFRKKSYRKVVRIY